MCFSSYIAGLRTRKCHLRFQFFIGRWADVQNTRKLKPLNPHTLLTTRRKLCLWEDYNCYDNKNRMIRIRTSTRSIDHKETVCRQSPAIHSTLDALFPLSDTSRKKILFRVHCMRFSTQFNLSVSLSEFHSILSNKRIVPQTQNVLWFTNSSPISIRFISQSCRDESKVSTA